MMMLQQQQGVGNPVPAGVIGNSGEGAAAAEAREPTRGGGGSGELGGGFNEEEKGRSTDESERNSAGNRWPRQETIALLKIRSEMDVVFRDSTLKGPLWDEVSRKLAELGYHRSAKKCKEKFENVYKYHKRTKDGRTTKPDGKTYRFFEQLEALDTHPSPSLSSPVKPHAPTMTTGMLLSNNNTNNTQVTVSSTPSPITTVFPRNATPIVHPINLSSQQQQPMQPPPINVTISPSVPSQSMGSFPSYNANMCGSLSSDSTSSTSSDQEPRKRKRKWEDFFGRLMTEVMQKQDELQKKFLDTLEKRERDRLIREEAWRVQEMAKMNREHDLLVQERSIAAAKDAAVIAFLQKITEQQNPQNPIAPPQLHQIQVQLKENSLPTTVPAAAAAPPPPPPVTQQQQQQQQQQQPPPPQQPAPAPAQSLAPSVKSVEVALPTNNGGEIFLSPSPSRWPKAEVQALIKLRTTLDNKYHENGPKGPLWEEISASMRKLGYNRNAKRCKEKWENINKYYKKVKESNKKRPEDAKTCPYFHQLEALYKEKAKTDGTANNSFNPGFSIKPENPMVPIMVQPEQQWPLPQQHQDSAMEDHESENLDQNNDDYEDNDEEEEDEDDGAGYEIVTNKQPSSVQVRAE